MGNQRHHLIGRAVQAAVVENGELSVDFGEGWHLVVINPFILAPDNAAGLAGSVLLTFEERETNEALVFENGTTLTIDMRDQSYRGPEAIILVGPGTSVVWN